MNSFIMPSRPKSTAKFERWRDNHLRNAELERFFSPTLLDVSRGTKIVKLALRQGFTHLAGRRRWIPARLGLLALILLVLGWMWEAPNGGAWAKEQGSKPPAHGQPVTQVPDALIDPGADWNGIILAVDKSQQRLFVYEYKNGQYILARTHDCSTGENIGDKKATGDKKTPEGFYLFTKKSLDTELAPIYGILAYPMDYPNFWDRRLGKEGSGIWMHGTNKQLTNLDSNGCVEMRNLDILNLENLIKLYDTPIVVYHDLKYKNVEELAREAARIRAFIDSWRKAWVGKNIREYRAMYAPDFTSDDGKDYQAWVAHKERINQQAAQISVEVGKLRLFRHQGMIVALFDQYYRRDHGFTSDGIKRLYLREKGGRYEIAAEVWNDFPPKESAKWISAQSRERVLAEAKSGSTMVASNTATRNSTEAPAKTPAPSKPPTPAKAPATEEPKTASEPAPKPVAVAKAPKPETDEIRKTVDEWLTSWRKKDIDRYVAYYHPDFRFRGMALDEFKTYKVDLARKNKNITIKVQKLDVQVEGSQALVTFIQDYRSDQHRDYGLKTLVMLRDKKNWRIKEESWQDMSAGAKP